MTMSAIQAKSGRGILAEYIIRSQQLWYWLWPTPMPLHTKTSQPTRFNRSLPGHLQVPFSVEMVQSLATSPTVALCILGNH